MSDQENPKSLHLNPFSSKAGGSSSEGQKTIMVDQATVAAQICKMAEDVRNSMFIMEKLNKQNANSIATQAELQQGMSSLAENAKETNKILEKLTSVGEKSLDVQEKLLESSNSIAKDMQASVKQLELMRDEAAKHMKSLNRNTAVLFVAQVTPRADGEDDVTYFFRLLKRVDEMYGVLETNNGEPLAG